MPDAAIRQRITDAVDALRVVDTHEHLEQEATRLKRTIDFGNWWSHYASSDLISAGMPPADLEFLRDAGQPIMDRWAKLEPHWAHVRTTAYGRALLLAARELYDAPDINRDTVEGLSARIAASNRPGWYREVLSERAGIAVSVQCGNTEGLDRELFNPVFHSDEWVMARTRFDFERLGQRTGVPIHTLDDLCAALSSALDAEQKAGICGMKSALAYVRILRYDKRTREEAERVFVRGFESHGGGVDWSEARPLQDFLFHQVIREGIRRNLTIQIHTGLQEGNGNFITNANPTHLTGLFMEYPEARFDLFHGGYPYGGELATLAKNFANVYIDMCWLHVISPTFAQRWLREWIETVPSNKISAFGGDYIFVEGAYAHSRMARQGVAATLAGLVEDGYFGEDEAIAVARKILRDNPASLFGLKV
ncbi:MAG TPA: amidohydrolase family protein [Armatimonadota bacterium]|nr:amidohydrolase family protein [Armatimonadota bacterium]